MSVPGSTVRCVDVAIDRAAPEAVGLAGVLVTPTGTSPDVGVIIVGGSEGGLHERDAVALAGAGFTALALAYFGSPGVPPVLREIPLEYFSRGVDLLVQRGVDEVAMLGGSRGGEAALLVASHDHRVTAVVSVVGSCVVTQGIDYSLGPVDRIMGTPTVAWTLDGEPLPALPNQVTDDLAAEVASGGPVGLGRHYAPLPNDPAQLDRISIPIEKSRAAVLLIAAEHDAMWNSAGYHRVAAERLAAAHHPYVWDEVVIPGAGHGIAGPPGDPITSTTTPGPGVMLEMGGDPAATTAGRAEAWRMTLDFLREHVA